MASQLIRLKINGTSGAAAFTAVQASFENRAGTVFPAGAETVAPFATTVANTHPAAWDGNAFTIPAGCGGNYLVCANTRTTSMTIPDNQGIALKIRVDGVNNKRLGGTFGDNYTRPNSVTGAPQLITLTAGQQIQVVMATDQEATLSSSSGDNNFWIQRIS